VGEEAGASPPSVGSRRPLGCARASGWRLEAIGRTIEIVGRARRGRINLLERDIAMRVALALASCAAASALWAASAEAGPCAEDLYRADVDIGKRLDALAARGKAGTESTFATLHRQPTPATVAGAEEQVGDVSAAQVDAVRKFMAEAKKADDAGDKAGCENALSEARKLLGM